MPIEVHNVELCSFTLDYNISSSLSITESYSNETSIGLQYNGLGFNFSDITQEQRANMSVLAEAQGKTLKVNAQLLVFPNGTCKRVDPSPETIRALTTAFNLGSVKAIEASLSGVRLTRAITEC